MTSYTPRLKHWRVIAAGRTLYVLAGNESKAVEVAEAELGVPPGSVEMWVEAAEADDSKRWLR